MKYFKQKNLTDCLLAAAENFTQNPRNKLGKVNWLHINKQKYLSYSSLAKILIKKSGGADLVFNGTVILENKPAILGWLHKLNGQQVCHAIFWDGKKAYCPARAEFINLEDLDICYVFAHKKYSNILGNRFRNIKQICKELDLNILNGKVKRNSSSLITLSFNGKVYPGNINRAFTDKIYEQL